MPSKYETGEDIIKRSKITRFELVEYVRNGLNPYTETGRIFNCPRKYNLKMKLDGINRGISSLEHPSFLLKNLSYEEQGRISNYGSPEILLHELKQSKLVVSKKMERLENKTGDRSWSWFYFDLPNHKKEAEKIINNIVDSYFLKDDVSKIIASNKKLRSCQRHKEACRKVAKKLWEKEPTLTIVAMSKRPEIIKACEGKRYVEKTIRRWIQDLNPNPKPGRRKGT